MDGSPAAMYNYIVAHRVWENIIPVFLFRKHIPTEEPALIINPKLSGNIWDGIAEFIRKDAERNDIEYFIVLLPFSIEERIKFNEVNRLFSKYGLRSESPAKGLTNSMLASFIVGRD